MLLIPCPWCGDRAETEFHCGGEVIARPTETDTLTDAQWGDYVFMRTNRKGVQHEQWCHASGCGRWFNALRDTVSYRILATWRVGEPAPVIEGEPAPVIEGESAAAIDGASASAAKDRPTQASEGKSAPATESRPASTTEGRPAPVTEGKAAAASENRSTGTRSVV